MKKTLALALLILSSSASYGGWFDPNPSCESTDVKKAIIASMIHSPKNMWAEGRSIEEMKSICLKDIVPATKEEAKKYADFFCENLANSAVQLYNMLSTTEIYVTGYNEQINQYQCETVYEYPGDSWYTRASLLRKHLTPSNQNLMFFLIPLENNHEATFDKYLEMYALEMQIIAATYPTYREKLTFNVQLHNGELLITNRNIGQ